MNETPIAESFSIVMAGNRNAGKSSLLNALFQKDVAIVSDEPGTTTDPVSRKIELGRLGPCAVVDTAGLDDEGALGALRVQKTRERLMAADLALFVSPRDKPPTKSEKDFMDFLSREKKPFVAVLTFADKAADKEKAEFFSRCDAVSVCALDRKAADISALLEKIESRESEMRGEMTPVEGIAREGMLAVLVAPIDTAAPKGRLILPQVETLRDLLDRKCFALVTTEKALPGAWERIGRKADIVITDSQAFGRVAEVVGEKQSLTSFSILFARKKGDIKYFARSLDALKNFPPNGKVLIMEACSHHRQADDIGTVKIPRLFREKVAAGATIENSRQMPERPEDFDLVIHCAACMATRQATLQKISAFKERGVPVVNYGMFLAWAFGLFPRALEPLPEFQ